MYHDFLCSALWGGGPEFQTQGCKLFTCIFRMPRRICFRAAWKFFSPQDLHNHPRPTSAGFLPKTLNSRNLPAPGDAGPERKPSRRKGQGSARNGLFLLTSIPGMGKTTKLICPLWSLRYSSLPKDGPRISLFFSVFHLLQPAPRQIHASKGAMLGSFTLNWNASQICPSLNREYFRLSSWNGNHQTKESAPHCLSLIRAHSGGPKTTSFRHHSAGFSSLHSDLPSIPSKAAPTGLCIPWLEPELLFPCLP